MGVGPRLLETFSKLGVMASRLESAKRPCSREEILLGFLQAGKTRTKLGELKIGVGKRSGGGGSSVRDKGLVASATK